MTTRLSSAHRPTSLKYQRTLLPVSPIINLGLQFSCQNAFPCLHNQHSTQTLQTTQAPCVALAVQSPSMCLILVYSTNISTFVGVSFLGLILFASSGLCCLYLFRFCIMF